MSRYYYLTAESKVISKGYIDSVIGGIQYMPVAKVEIIDVDSTTYELSSCTSFNISLRRETPLAEFNIEIEQAIKWNPRTTDYVDLLFPDLRKRIKIYFGQVISGEVQYVLMMTGVMIKAPETYSHGSSDIIKIKGNNLGYLLLREVGTYSTSQFTGSSKTLVQYWCDQVGITYNLTYTDTIQVVDATIAYDNSLRGILDILEVLGPDVEAYFTPEGQFTMRDAPWWSLGLNEYNYDEDTIINLSKIHDPTKIVTKAEATGITANVSHTREPSEAVKNIYGVNKISVSSGLIRNLSQAQALTYDLLKHGVHFMDMASVMVQLNPYINIGSYLTIADSVVSNIPVSPLRVTKVEHKYRVNRVHETTMEGYLNESSSSSSSSSVSSSSSSSSVSSSSSSCLSLSSSSSSSLSSSSLSLSSSSSSSAESVSSSSSSSSSLSSSSSSLSLSSSSNSSISNSSSSKSSSSKSSSSSSLSSSSSSGSSSSLSMVSGNDFSGDPNCVALWRFEDGALTADSIGTNILTNNNGVVSNQVDYKEGAASADFELDSSQCFYIADGDLDANFPLKNGDSNKKISICFWFQRESSVASSEILISKWDSTLNTRSLLLQINSSNEFRFYLGYNGGASAELVLNTGTVLATGRFFHFGFTFQDSDKAWKIVIWDDTAESKIVDASGTAGQNINVEDSPFVIGGYFDNGSIFGSYDGEKDEVVVFKDILTTGEIDEIRQGVYNGS